MDRATGRCVGTRAAGWLTGACVALCTLACGDDSTTPGPLADPAQWALVAASDDPFAPEGPMSPACDAAENMMDFEGQAALSIETEHCDHLTVAQPALLRVRYGDHVHLRVYHDELTADAPGEGHVALTFNGVSSWQTRMPIPSPRGVIDVTFSSVAGLDRGDPLEFHLHDAGPNFWALLELSVAP